MLLHLNLQGQFDPDKSVYGFNISGWRTAMLLCCLRKAYHNHEIPTMVSLITLFYQFFAGSEQQGSLYAALVVQMRVMLLAALTPVRVAEYMFSMVVNSSGDLGHGMGTDAAHEMVNLLWRRLLETWGGRNKTEANMNSIFVVAPIMKVVLRVWWVTTYQLTFNKAQRRKCFLC